MCAAIPTSLALVGGDKANAADVEATKYFWKYYSGLVIK